MEALITLLPGDGIGPEVAAAGRTTGTGSASQIKHGHGFQFSEQLIGGAAIDACGEPLPARHRCCLQGKPTLYYLVPLAWSEMVGPECELCGLSRACSGCARCSACMRTFRPVKVYDGTDRLHRRLKLRRSCKVSTCSLSGN